MTFGYNAPNMLKFLRHKGIQKRIYMGLAIAVVLTFVVSGVLISRDDPKAMSSLAKLNNHKISVQEYLASYQAVQRQAGWMYGDRLNEMRSRINFKGEAWDRILLLDYAKKEKVRVLDEEVVDWIRKQGGFQKDGKFNDEFYQMYVERGLRTTPRQFEEEVRQMLAIGKVQKKVQESVDLSDERLKELYKQERLEKDLVYGLLETAAFEAQVPDVKDTEVSKLYETVKDTLKDEKDGHPLTLEEAKERLTREIREGEARTLAVKKMGEVKAKIQSPADFETVLKAENIEPARIEKYKKGTYPSGIWPSENLQKAVEKLDKDGVSDVFDVPKGAMIVKVTATHEFDEKKFEEEKKDFREQMASQQGREKMEALLEGLRDKLSLNLELMKELFPADAA